MAIEIMFINVIIPIRNIDKCRQLGGFETFLKNKRKELGKVRSRRILVDDYLYRDGAMSPGDTKLIVDFWEAQGLVVTEVKNGKTYWKDLCVVDFLNGPTLPCDWIGYDRATNSVWMKNKAKGKLVSKSEDNIR